MKKIILLMLFVTSLTNAQKFTLETKAIIGVFDAEGKTKSDIFSSINKWISINYNSYESVVQMNDLESGTIIIKGINESNFKNLLKVIWPKPKYYKEYTNITFNHLIEINIQDNRFRIIYTITDIVTKNDDWFINNLMFKCINFNEINDNDINNYNEYMKTKMKKFLVGKKKRAKVYSSTKPALKELSNNLLIYIELIMKSIENSVTKSAKEGW